VYAPTFAKFKITLPACVRADHYHIYISFAAT
jgi:hypothetical protein